MIYRLPQVKLRIKAPKMKKPKDNISMCITEVKADLAKRLMEELRVSKDYANWILEQYLESRRSEKEN